MDDYCPKCTHDIAETCCDSISIDELEALCEDKSMKVMDTSVRLGYGEIRGSNDLRDNLARLYSSKAGSFTVFCPTTCLQQLKFAM
jgi:hypothetical protein